MVRWLGFHALTAEGPGSIPGQGTKIPQAAWCGKKKKKKAVEAMVQWSRSSEGFLDEALSRKGGILD